MSRILDDLTNVPKGKSNLETLPHYAVAYLRVSHEDSAERGASIAVQRKEIATFAEQRGIEIVEWFEDLGLSAYKDEHKRVGFKNMLARAKHDASISLVLVWKSGRFSRTKYIAAASKGELSKYGVKVLSVTEPYDPDTREGVIFDSIGEAMNQVRSMELSQLIHKSLLENCTCRDQNTGFAYKNGGMAQFGYRNERIYADVDRKYQRISHCIWLLDEEIVNGHMIWEWTRTMLVDWRLGQGMGIDAIAGELTAAGIPSPRNGGPWSASSVYYLLQKDKLLQYAGYGFYNRRSFQNGGKRHRSLDEWKIIENAHPAIISVEEADAIYALGRSRKQIVVSKDRKPSRYLLSGGTMICSSCGSPLAGRTKKGVDYYLCGSYLYRRGEGCSACWHVRKDDLETAVIGLLEDALPEDAASLDAVLKRYNHWASEQVRRHGQTEMQRVEAIKTIERKIERLMTAVAEGLPAGEVSKAVSELSSKKQRLEQLGSMQPPKPILGQDLLRQARELRQRLECSDNGQKKMVLLQFIRSIAVDPEKKNIVIEVKSPLPQPGMDFELGHSVGSPEGIRTLDLMAENRASLTAGCWRQPCTTLRSIAPHGREPCGSPP